MKFENWFFWSIKNSKLHFILNERCGSKATQTWFRDLDEPCDESFTPYIPFEIIEKKPICMIRNPIERWRSGVGHRLGQLLAYKKGTKTLKNKPNLNYLWDEKMIYQNKVNFFDRSSRFYNWSRDIFLLSNLLHFDFKFMKLSSLSEVIDFPNLTKNSSYYDFENFLEYCDYDKPPNITFDFINDLIDLSNFNLVEIKKMYSKYPIFFSESIMNVFEHEMMTWSNIEEKL